ncbi:MAG: phosphotransferase family protein [Rhodospirillaceae bacterium]|nr:phosphotransferase family protein [Rhodospirillaceae bacterium]
MNNRYAHRARTTGARDRRALQVRQIVADGLDGPRRHLPIRVAVSRRRTTGCVQPIGSSQSSGSGVREEHGDPRHRRLRIAGGVAMRFNYAINPRRRRARSNLSGKDAEAPHKVQSRAMPEVNAHEPIDILPAHRFNEAALIDYLSRSLDGFEPPAVIRQFQGGQSNPTFLIQTPSKKYVLRKKPPGKLLPSAHQVEREFTVMKALHGTGVPVPEPLVLCEDPAIIGTAFYVMGFVEGRIFTTPAMPDSTPDQRAGVYASMAETLARLHGVDWRNCGLATFGRPDGYLNRQVERWSKQYLSTKTAEMPAMDQLMAWLPSRIPATSDSAIAHGDYRLGNLLIDPRRPTVAAIVDWELATIGHPLADLAYCCMAYRLPPDDPVFPGLAGADLGALGIPTEAQFVAAYCRAAGRDRIDDWAFFLAFSFFRLAAITQGVYARGLQGNASDLKATSYGAVARRSAEQGWLIASRGAEPGRQEEI